MKPLMRIENAGYGYNNQWVVRGVDFSLLPGELVGLIGPNGSGKTTLMKLLDRILEPREGKIFWKDLPLERLSRAQVARRIALVLQEVSFVFAPTVLEVVLMGRAPYLRRFQMEGPRDLQLAEKAMEQTRITHLKDRRLDQLSSGERQRVFIARALCQEPALLLLDEPTAFLDIRHQVNIMDLILELNRSLGLTILVASHDINLAAQYCRRLIFIREGRLQGIGPPREVVNQALIEQVFETPVMVDQNPYTGTPRIILVGGTSGGADGSSGI